ncbi:hypothetical protein LCGC14_2351360 [marine sediment metagenome]|uniref:Uncharacterized protein n=1 Tax=marine sediment metagenome TaxID=412755 RepID=A0A0F9C922_9ZZZZ
MKEIILKLSLEDIIQILEFTAVDNFEMNKSLVEKIIRQIPGIYVLSNDSVLWDRLIYFMTKICE